MDINKYVILLVIVARSGTSYGQNIQLITFESLYFDSSLRMWPEGKVHLTPSSDARNPKIQFGHAMTAFLRLKIASKRLPF